MSVGRASSPSTVSLSSVEAAAPVPSAPPSAAGPPPVAPQQSTAAAGNPVIQSPLGRTSSGAGVGAATATSRLGLTTATTTTFSPRGAGGANTFPPPVDMVRLKERECLTAATERCSHLERLVHAKDVEIARLKQEMDKLQKDFNYNYSVIQERDAELLKYMQAVDHAGEDRNLLEARVKEANGRAHEAEDLLNQTRKELQKVSLEGQDTLAVEQRKREQLRIEYESKLRTKEQSLTEAQDKLQQHYLSRVKDEEGAIQRQIKQLQEEHRTQEDNWQHQEQMLTREVESLRTNLAAERENTTLLREKIAAVEGRLTTALRVEQTLNKRLEEARVEGSRATSRLGELEVSLADTQASDVRLRDEHHSRLKTLTEELTESRARVFSAEQKLEREKSTLEEMKHTHERQLSDLQTRHKNHVAELEARFNLAEEREKTLETELRAYRESEEDAQHQSHHLRCELQKLQGEKSDQSRATELAVHDTDRARQQTKELREELLEARESVRKQQLNFDMKERDWFAEREDLHKKIHSLERTQNELKVNWEEKERNLIIDLRSSEERRASLEDVKEHIESVSTLQRMIESLTAERDRLRVTVKELQDKNLSISEQVAAITLEMENDPQILQAKKNATRIVELQDELVMERTKNNQLEITLRERATQVQWLEQELTSARPAGDIVARLTSEKQQVEKKLEEIRRTNNMSITADGREALKVEHEGLRREIEILEKKLSKTCEERDEARKEFYELLRKHDLLKEENENLQKTGNLHLAQARRATELLLQGRGLPPVGTPGGNHHHATAVLAATTPYSAVNPHASAAAGLNSSRGYNQPAHGPSTAVAAGGVGGGPSLMTNDPAATLAPSRYRAAGGGNYPHTVNTTAPPGGAADGDIPSVSPSYGRVAPEIDELRADYDNVKRELEELKRQRRATAASGGAAGLSVHGAPAPTTSAGVPGLVGSRSNSPGAVASGGGTHSMTIKKRNPLASSGGARGGRGARVAAEDFTSGCERCEKHEAQFNESVVRRGEQAIRNFAADLRK